MKAGNLTYGKGRSKQTIEDAIRERIGKATGELMADDFARVTELDLANMRVSDISALAACTALESLSLASTQVSDISALAACTALESLFLINTRVSDVSMLAECVHVKLTLD